MKKEIELNSTIYDLCNDCPDIADILFDLGFKDIVKPGMISTAGRFMTLPKGAAMRHIDMAVIKRHFQELGYVLIE